LRTCARGWSSVARGDIMETMKELPDEVFDRIIARLVEALRPDRIYLFGSHAYGTPHRHSDVDFLVVVPDDAGDRWELAGRGWIALRGLAVPVEIVVFHRHEMDKWTPVKGSLPHAVAQKGKLVYAA